MPVVVAPDHVFHDVATGVWCGVTEASDELPARAEILATAGQLLAHLDRPTVFVHEGGYVL